MSTYRKPILVLAVLALAATGIYLFNHKAVPANAPVAEIKPVVTAPSPTKPSISAQAGNQSWQKQQQAPEAPVAPIPDYGRTPATPLAMLDNEQAKSNLEALQNPSKFPERLTEMVGGALFDQKQWESNPQYRAKYLSVAEPSRGYRSSPNPKAPQLKRLSEINPVVAHGEKIVFRVQSLPGFPVSAFSKNLNRFENGLTSITVVSDAQGIAEITMEGVPGTIARTEVACSSPVCAGTVFFKVDTVQSNPQALK